MKRILASIAVILAICFLSACSEPFRFGAAVSDWIFDDLPGGYEIWKINSRNIVLQKRFADERALKEIIGTYISRIAYDENYIFVQQVTISEDYREPIDLSAPSFFIVSVSDDTIFGPASESDFSLQCDVIEPDKDIEWVDTTDLPSK